jgi:AcrR family transcriptional regulator
LPQIFSETDRQAIRRTLREKGRELFLRYGLRKTKVSELARAAGIAKGTFYHFFDSKEELCLEIFHHEEEDLRGRLRELLARHEDARGALRAVLDFSLRFAREDSLLARLRESGEYALLARLRESGEYALLARGAGQARLAEHLSRDVEFVESLLTALRAKGALCPLPPEVVAGILRAVVLLAFHEQEIGPGLYAPALEHLVDWIAQGITGMEGRR